MTEQVKRDKVTIDGVEYSMDELSVDVKNAIAARQEIQNSKVRHLIELEKIDVLTNHYNEKIKKGLEKIKK